MAANYGWVVVQHSGFGYRDNPQWKRGLETRKLSRKEDADLVRRVGGVIYRDYIEAEMFADSAMFPDDNASFVPDARGDFSAHMIDNLRIYIPVRAAVG